MQIIVENLKTSHCEKMGQEKSKFARQCLGGVYFQAQEPRPRDHIFSTLLNEMLLVKTKKLGRSKMAEV